MNSGPTTSKPDVDEIPSYGVRTHRWRRSAAIAAALAVSATGVASSAAAPSAERAQNPKVKVGDDFFAPSSLKVKPGTKVRFKWASSNINPHNVTLTKGPKRVQKKKFKSATGSIGVRFAPKFTKRGRYNFLCTIHPNPMTITVNVKK